MIPNWSWVVSYCLVILSYCPPRPHLKTLTFLRLHGSYSRYPLPFPHEDIFEPYLLYFYKLILSRVIVIVLECGLLYLRPLTEL